METETTQRFSPDNVNKALNQLKDESVNVQVLRASALIRELSAHLKSVKRLIKELDLGITPEIQAELEGLDLSYGPLDSNFGCNTYRC